MCVRMHVCVCMCVYVCVYVCMYVCLYHGVFKPSNQIAQFALNVFHTHLLGGDNELFNQKLVFIVSYSPEP